MPSDDATLLDLLVASRRALEGVGTLSVEDLEADWKAQSIVMHQLLVLGEAVKRLSSEFRQRHSQIRWRQMAGMRDILIHSYDTVDIQIVRESVIRDLPALIAFLETLVPEDDPQSI